MKRIFISLLLVLSTLTSLADSLSGNCGKDGDNLTWSLDRESGVLKIEGSGMMKDYKGSTVPWYSELVNILYVELSDGLTNIGNYAFFNCKNLNTVTIPNSVENIGEFALYNCSRLSLLTIGKSVTNIGPSAFYGCKSLTSINIPNTVTNIGINAFNQCSGLTSINLPNSLTSIEGSVFSSCSKLTSLSIPNSVTSIGNGAFSGCSGLISITIPNSVQNIGSYAFSSCLALTSINIPNSVSSIESNTFWGCSGLTSITIPNSVTSIKNCAFQGCSGLTSITIPNSVTSIEDNTFSGCDNITSLYMNSKVYYSILCKELYLGDDISVVYSYYNSIKLNKVVLGKNVTQIRADAFKSAKINEFTITGEEPPYCYQDIFGTKDLSSATLYVPESKVSYYQTTEPWTKFGTILTLSGETPEAPALCATPTITLEGCNLKFACETEGAEIHYTISSAVSNSGIATDVVPLSCNFTITAYATAEGYTQSEPATLTIPLSTLMQAGDVNSDGKINVTDVTNLVKMILDKK